MSRLDIALLGTFEVRLDGERVTRFRSDSVRALLAYLALHAGASQRRETLSGLLWPEEPERVARHNLRQTLSLLRGEIGDREADPPYLHITRHEIAWNPESDYALDAAAFAAGVETCARHTHRRLEACPECTGRLEEAVALYRGELLAGFSLPSAAFEDWLAVERERLRLQAVEALFELAAYH